MLNVVYVEAGPADGPAVFLLHGWPYDIHSFVDVSPRLAAKGYRVITPYTRGYGATRFLSDTTVRNGQPSAVAHDVVDLMDALKIDKAVLAGFDWGARSADIVAALWPERCNGLVSVSGYLIGSQASGKVPLPPAAELQWWYQFYFASERGRLGYEQNHRDFAKLIWKQASPRWAFDDATFDRSAPAFDNPDHATIVVHNYRWRLGVADGERQYDDFDERRLAMRRPRSACRPSPWRATPTARRTSIPAPTPRNSPANTPTGRSPAASATTCRRRPRASSPRRCSTSGPCRGHAGMNAVRFALLHGVGFGDVALLAVRVGVGGFFIISGYHKLFNAARRQALRDTFATDGVKFAPMMRIIPLAELLGGLGVAFGALTIFAATGLAMLCLGATRLDGLKRIPSMGPLDRADRVGDVLYLPEILYVLCLIVVLSFGPGAFSLDALVWR